MFETTLSLFLMFLVTGALMYLILCIDPNNPGFLGKMHRLVYNYVPNLINKALGGQDSKATKIISNICNYFCYTNHPIVQIFYILVAPGGFCLYWYAGFSQHFDNNSQISYIHKYIAIIFSYFAFYSYYLACKTGPGEITAKNVNYYLKKYNNYYDEIIYRKNNKCNTCDIVKPARSKHCSTCKMCVAKFDHHCIWIRQCVGEKNYKYFLSFLLIHALYTLYGLVIGIYCIYGLILDQQLLDAKFKSPTGEVVNATYGIVLRYIFFKETLLVFIVLLCGIMSIALSLFYIYHLTLVKGRTTTNEKIKISDCKSYIKKQLKLIPKELEKLEKDGETEKYKEMHKKMENFLSDYEKLDKWQPEMSLWECLKEIYRQ